MNQVIGDVPRGRYSPDFPQPSAPAPDSGGPPFGFDSLVLLPGTSEVSASKRFYAKRGFLPGKSFGSYVEFQSPTGVGIKLALYSRVALARDAGVPAEGSGAHRVEIGSGAGAFTDPDCFAWAYVRTSQSHTR